MSLPRFDYLSPRSLPEALDLMARHGRAARPLAGGTDLLPKMAKRALRPAFLLSLRRVRELRPIAFDPEVGLTIGATARLNELIDHPAVAEHYPAMAFAASQTATVQIRNMGTLAGNLCNGSPCADNAPTLLAREARAEVASARGHRLLPLEEFFQGPGVTALAPDEILVRIHVPPPRPGRAFAFRNLSGRSRVDISAVSVGAGVVGENGRCADVRLFLGAVAPIPLRAVKAEDVLRGKVLSAELLREAAEIAAGESRPITDVRATASYRRLMVAVLARRALAEAAARAGLRIEPSPEEAEG